MMASNESFGYDLRRLARAEVSHSGGGGWMFVFLLLVLALDLIFVFKGRGDLKKGGAEGKRGREKGESRARVPVAGWVMCR